MSRPFDGSLSWWAEELGQLAQMVHQGHHHGQRGTWKTCPIASCARTRAVLEEAGALTEKKISQAAFRRVLGIIRVSPKITSLQAMPMQEALIGECIRGYLEPDDGGDVCLPELRTPTGGYS